MSLNLSNLANTNPEKSLRVALARLPKGVVDFLDKLSGNGNRVVKYFMPYPKLKPILTCAAIGLLCIFGGIAGLSGGEEGPGVGLSLFFLFVGLGVFALAVFLFAKGFFGRATDQEVDAFVMKEIVGKQRERALKKLDLEWDDVKEIPPIELWGWDFGDKKLDCVAGLIDIEGLDGVWRSPEIECNDFYFSEETVHYNRWIASVVMQTERQSTDEIYYKDIVSVKQDSVTEKLSNGGSVQVETFAIRHTGAESIQCPAASDEIERAVSAFRAQLKSKKTS